MVSRLWDLGSGFLSTLRALEFDRIVSVVSGLAVTPTGHDRLAELHPSIDAAEITEAQRFERAAVNGKRLKNSVQVRRRTEREARVVGEKPGAFGRGLLRGGDLGGIGRGVQLRQSITPRRRHRQAADNGNNAIEFEGPQRARIHGFRWFRWFRWFNRVRRLRARPRRLRAPGFVRIVHRGPGALATPHRCTQESPPAPAAW